MVDPSYAKKVVEIHEISDKICNDWEARFIQNMITWAAETDDDFTDKQKAVIDKLYEKACSSPY